MSTSDLLAPPEEQVRIMGEALARIKAHAFYMKKSLEADRTLEAIKHAIEMAAELRIGSLTPKHYYELYMMAFDNLRYLASLLTDAHRARRANLAELYELVQYSTTIVPRLYLMITVGAAYMPIGETPIKIILRDLIDMTRGVQHPVRGLFLRHYLSSMTKDYLPDGDTLEVPRIPSPAVPAPVGSDVPPEGVVLGNGGEQQATELAAVVPVHDAEDDEENKPLVGGTSPDRDRGVTAESVGADSTKAQHVPSIISPDEGNAPQPTNSTTDAAAAATATSSSSSTAAAPTSASDQLKSSASTGAAADGTPAVPFHGTVDDSIGFVMQNFVEMNKLWVRLQHQGATKDRERREVERRELRILVGTNIVRLSQLQAVDLPVYQHKILPPILEQIISCRDVIAQEYLMEVIIQVFPDTFHLRTLEPILAVTAQLQPQVNIKQIIVALIDRLRAYAADQQEKAAARAAASASTATDGETAGEASTAAPTTNAADEDDDDEGIPENLHLFEVFWTQISQVITARPDLGLPDISSLLLSLIQLSVACYPDQISYVDQILRFAREQVAKYLGTSELANAVTVANLQALLLAPLQPPKGITGVGALPGRPIVWLLQLPNDAQAFRDLLALQPYSTRHAVALYMINHLVRQRAVISTEAHLLALLDCLQVMIKDQKDAPLWKNTGMFVDRESLGMLQQYMGAGGGQQQVPEEVQKRREQLDELGLEQALVAKFVALVGNEDTIVHAQLLTVARKYLTEGGGFRLKHTFPSLLTQAVRLIDRVLAKYAPLLVADANGLPPASPPTSATEAQTKRNHELMNLFKFMHQLIMNIQHKSDDVVLATHLFLVAARSADSAGLEEIAYEFFVSALTVYEECINDSRVQFHVLTAVVNTLIESRVFAVDNFDTLATKCTLHASRLLKRPDQCRAVVMCSHLFWSSVEKYREAKRVLECLQKALKFADACLDSVMNVELLIETLARYIYFYEKGCPVITPKYINSLLELIATNLSNLHDAGGPDGVSDFSNSQSNGTTTLAVGGPGNGMMGRGFSTSSLVGLEVGGGGESGTQTSPLLAVTNHFKRTCTMLRERQANPPRSLGEQVGPFYHEIVVPRVPY
ncbi:vacuolar protein sorting-associated protein 35-domain-containing protein [Catenaria anguillulae PL171]|uniref:Vacuolar protein sorting-associated protein 35-domain-containing protein n=1 Tax=Catenaria anguillulae PL171 TaxID=765915 RepID=A0A1Y2HTK6_9FUNG|nr:vacuolar protein sorting-associated protein 35-domain-containing protein [Catenaria anguillulae PL171]